MEKGDFGVDCETCECLICKKNDNCCQNCVKCNGDSNRHAYDRWKKDCNKCEVCNNPEETIKIILGDTIT